MSTVTSHDGTTIAYEQAGSAVDDADATAARSTGLGGKVIAPPFDAPWVRMTVIADPQGATFIARKFVPEDKDLGSGTDAAAGAGIV
jgi:hypothetical protein